MKGGPAAPRDDAKGHTTSATDARTLVIVPAFNECASIGAVVSSIRASAPRADILVVDDGSTDDTAAIATAAGAVVARLPYNLGVGGAMRTGYRFAWRHKYDVAVQVDGDGQHDPAFVGRLVERLDEADVVIGARFAGEGSFAVGRTRGLAMTVVARVMSAVVGSQITDATSGFRATNRRGIELFARNYPAEYLGDTIEALVIARRAGLRTAQVPVRMSPRTAGRASQGTFSSSLYLGRAFAAVGLGLVRRWPAVELPS